MLCVHAFWAYKMAPYLFIALPITLIFSLAKLKSKHFCLNIIMVTIPFVGLFDTLVNYFLAFFYAQSDFGIILQTSPWLYIPGVLLVLFITFLSKHWIKNYTNRPRKTKRKGLW